MYLPYAQLWLTDAALQTTEARIGYKLPAAWIALLRIQNVISARPCPVSHHIIYGIGTRIPPLTQYD